MILGRRKVLGWLASSGAALALPASAGGRLQTSLRPVERPAPPSVDLPAGDIAAWVAEARLQGSASIGLMDLADGTLREGLDADATLPPASVMKALTSVYAIDTLGAGHRFVTRVLATGPLADGTLAGDLILAGGSDPDLDTDDLAALADRLAAAGVRRVTGRFLVWAGPRPEIREIEPGQADHLDYNPAISGLNLNYNRVYFEWKRSGDGYVATLDARGASLQPPVSVARMTVEDRDLPVYRVREIDGVEVWSVARGALGEGGARWLPVRHPARYAADVFRSLCASRSLALPEAQILESLPEAREVARLESRPLVDTVVAMLKYSTNLVAEVIGLAATRARGVDARTLPQSAAEMRRWFEARGGTSGPLQDHSGLSDRSAISAAALLSYLAQPQTVAVLKPLLKDVAVVDANGAPLRNDPAHVVAKSGTLNFVSNLAGYIDGAGGGHFVFAILTASPDLRRASETSQDDIPPGARSWSGRSRNLQHKLIRRWSRG